MGPPDTSTRTNVTGEKEPTPLLYNDVFAARWAVAAPSEAKSAFAPFSRLPVELRLHISLLCLQHHRMIEIDIHSPADENDTSYPGDVSQSHSRYYRDRNQLGNIVSGRGYTLRLSGQGPDYPTSLTSPLLSVNHEARRAALSFYHVRLPFPGLRGKQGRILYLSPEYDVVCVRPREPGFRDDYDGYYPRAATVLVDFLHDVKAHDYKDQGIAHLALRSEYLQDLFDRDAAPLAPATLHPAAAASFTDMLHRTLRSVLCVVGFRHQTRALGEFPRANWRYHFAQTFPLCRKGRPAGAFHWLTTDPRPGVELDLRQLPLDPFIEPHRIARCWEELEEAFGITKEQRAARAINNKKKNSNNNKTNGLGLYICPTHDWPSSLMPDDFESTTPSVEEGSREQLARHLRFEEQDWLRERKMLTDMFEGATRVMPKHGQIVDAETFDMMERVPVTAVGMWVFPVEAFAAREPTIVVRNCWDLEGVRPGLFLFEV